MKKLLSYFLFAVLCTWTSLSFAKQPELVVYTYSSFISEYGPGEALAKSFTEKHNIKIKFVASDDAVMMFNKVRLEGKNTKADIVLGLDQNMLDMATKADIFVANKIDLKQLKSTLNWHNQIFTPYDYGQFAFIYNKEKLKKVPVSLKQLVDNENIKVIYQDPRVSSVGQGLVMWFKQVYNNDANKFWQKLAKHTVTVGKGWSSSYGLFLKGESDAVLSYTTSELYHKLIDKTDKYAAMIFRDGHPLQIELMAIPKYSKQQALAEKFMQFLLEPENQKIISLNNWMLPVINTEVDPVFAPYLKVKVLPISAPTEEELKQLKNNWQESLIK